MKTTALLTIFSLFALAKAPRALADDCTSITPSNLAACAAQLDPLQGADWRPQMPGAYRSPLGIQVAPGCFALARGVSREAAERRVEALIDQAFLDVLGPCQARYPELRFFLSEWLAQARRTVVVCTSLPSASPRWGGEKIGAQMPSDFAALYALVEPKAELARIPRAALADFPAHHEPVVLYPSDELRELNLGSAFSDDAPVPSIVGTLIHEILHSTDADNLVPAEHNRVEQIKVTRDDPHDSCAASVADDRVNLIADLCSGDGQQFPGFLSAEDAVAYRMDRLQCGRERGCTRIFSRSSDGRRSLDADSASRLCDRIEDQGTCASLGQTLREPILRSPPTRQAAQAAVDRLASLLPSKTNELPMATLRAFPDLYSRLASLSRTRCFRTVFGPPGDAGTSWTVQGVSGIDLKRDPDNRSGRFTVHDVFEQAATLASECGDVTHAELLHHVLESYSNALFDATSSEFYIHELQPRYAFGVEQGNGLTVSGVTTDIIKDRDGVEQERLRLLRQWLGPQVFDTYRSMVWRFDPTSPGFDCKAAGVTVHDINGREIDLGAELSRAGLAH